jgi:ubiquinone/menaquinone biosynthesis C-methylase UbiE
MNSSHFPLTTWALGHIEVAVDSTALDIGCGGGRTVDRLAKIAVDGWVVGLDYSEDAVVVARRKNANHIHNGRVEICHASVSSIPYDDNTFDLVTAIETLYFWEAPDADLQEVQRVMIPGGQLLIACTMYKGGKHDARNRRFVDEFDMHYLSVEDLQNLLEASQYEDVRVIVEYDKGWICAAARKAQAPAAAQSPSATRGSPYH